MRTQTEAVVREASDILSAEVRTTRSFGPTDVVAGLGPLNFGVTVRVLFCEAITSAKNFGLKMEVANIYDVGQTIYTTTFATKTEVIRVSIHRHVGINDTVMTRVSH